MIPRRVVGPFHHLRGIIVSNVFLLDGGPGNRWLVDCGHWSERPQLMLGLQRAGVSPRDLTGVLLTHRHSDHAGNASFLQQRYGVRIYAHRRDAEILDGTVPRPHMPFGDASALAGMLTFFENLWPARVAIERALDAGDVIAGLEVHWLPGHTEGSVFYRHHATRTLLTGDTLLTAIPPLVQTQGLALSHPTFSIDVPQSAASVGRFHREKHDYDHVLAGHGLPLVSGARPRIEAFLRSEGIDPG